MDQQTEEEVDRTLKGLKPGLGWVFGRLGLQRDLKSVAFQGIKKPDGHVIRVGYCLCFFLYRC